MLKKKSEAEVKNVLYALLAGVCLAILYWGILSPLYSMSDDIGMSRISYGTSGAYSSYLIYINILIGGIIKGLMQAAPSIPWYSVVQCGVIFFAYTTIIFVLFEELGRQGSVFPFVVITLFFGYDYFDGMQFSQTAGIACIAGILLMFCAIKRKNPWMHIVAGFLIFLGSLYRFEVFLMVLIPLAGIGFYLIANHIREKNLAEVLCYVLPFAVAFSCCFAARIYDRQAYQRSEDWSTYMEWSAASAKLVDYGLPDYEKNEALYQELNLSQEDYEMLRNRWFADPDVFSTPALQKLVAARESNQLSVRLLAAFTRTMMIGWSGYTFSPALLLSLILIFLGGRGEDNTAKRKYRLLVYELLAFVGVNFYLYYSGRCLQKRIDIVLLLAVVLALLLYCQQQNVIQNRKLSFLLSIVVVCCLAADIRNTCYENVLQTRSQRQASQEKYRLSELLLGDSRHLYLYDGGMTLSYETGYLPKEGSEKNLYCLLGWWVMMPDQLQILEQYQVRNPYQDAVDSQGIYFITTPDNIAKNISHIQRHYAEDAEATLAKMTEYGYQVYRILTKDPLVETEHAVAGEGIIKSDLQWMVNEGVVSGYIYGEGINSFSSNIYIEGLTRTGERRIYCAAQEKADFSDDVMNGAYGAFTCKVKNLEEITAVYLETNDALYRLAGTEVTRVGA